MNEYGIQTERSHIRAHVSPTTKAVYVYRTAAGLAAIQNGTHPKLPAFQPGHDGPTAWGYVVPVEDIPDIRTLHLTGTQWWEGFRESADTSEKGRLAVGVVQRLLQNGRFPLWVAADEVSDMGLQLEGTDIIAWGNWRIQVKCDYKAGPRALGGTGNLYLQVEEINPLGKY